MIIFIRKKQHIKTWFLRLGRISAAIFKTFERKKLKNMNVFDIAALSINFKIIFIKTNSFYSKNYFHFRKKKCLIDSCVVVVALPPAVTWVDIFILTQFTSSSSHLIRLVPLRKMFKKHFAIAVFAVLSAFASQSIAEVDENASSDLYIIEGKVFPPENAASPGWQLATHVMANGGEHFGYLRCA